ncbi:hypothetical protein GCM10023147_39910 [Tsukamurella soli]|uniref:Uncharacterized protein n=1 Tax=Tsukamurella soli TaxID=644556 RepID=A0ABP8K5D7_9ACTN
MGEDGVEQRHPATAPRDRQAERGEVLDLSESPGQRGLPAVVRPGDHQDPLARPEDQVVTYHRFAAPDQLGGKCEVERLPHVEGGACARTVGHRREYERQPRGGQRTHVVEIAEIERQLAVEPLQRGVDVPVMALAERRQRAEGVAVRACDEVEYGGLDTVQPRRRRWLRCRVRRPGDLELAEHLRHLGAVVGLAAIAPHLDVRPLDLHAVDDVGEGRGDALHVGAQRGEAGGAEVGVQMTREAAKRRGPRAGGRQPVAQPGDTVGVARHTVQRPPVALRPPGDGPRRGSGCSDLRHRCTETVYRRTYPGVGEVAAHVLAVAHGGRVREGEIEDRGGVGPAARDDGVGYPIQFQIAEDERAGPRPGPGPRRIRGSVEQDAGERHGRSPSPVWHRYRGVCQAR